MKGLFFIAFVAVVVYVYSEEIDVECPEFEEDTVYIANPCNCSTYYVCSLTGKTLMPCPKGLHFNQEKEVCDWPKRAKCKVDPRCTKKMPKSQLEDEEFLA